MCYNQGMTQRIVALDIGDKRIGVAYSDPFGEYAVPGDTYFRTGDLMRDVAAMKELAERENAGAVVCGLPLNADGTESIQTRKTADPSTSIPLPRRTSSKGILQRAKRRTKR